MGWNRFRSQRRAPLPAALLILGLSAAISRPARSQCVDTSVTNGQVSASVGVSGTPTGATTVNCAGRFGATEPGATGGVLLAEAASAVNQSYLTVRIDGGPTTPGVDTGATTYTQGGWDLIFGDKGSNELDATNTNAKTDQGAWLVQPVASGTSITATWTTLPGANATHPIPRIEVALKLTLVHDMVLYQFTVTNRDVAAHTVQLRFAQDFNVPGAPDGPVITPNQGQICTDTDLPGALVPATWRARNGATGQSVGASLVLPNAVFLPNRVTFGSTTSTNLPLFNFVPNPLSNFCTSATRDGGSDVYFDMGNLPGGTSRQVSTAFGRQTSTIDFSNPWAAGVQGPSALTYDPTQPVGQQLTPSPFTVTAFINNNLLGLDLTNATAVLNLPTGLALAPGETATHTLGSVAVGTEATTSWQVMATGAASGRLTYSVAFSAGPGAQGKVVTRDIDVPSLPTQTFNAGLQMVSFPYTFTDPTPSVALGISQFDLLRWNPAVNVYEAVARLQPGEGYWLRLPQNTTVNLSGATPVPVGSTNFEIKLLNGWNQIGNPWLTRVQWSDLMVITTDVGDPNYLVPLSVPAAAQAGLIAPTLYFYDPASGEYRFDTDFSTQLVPFQGYWAKALKNNISLLVPPPTGRAAARRAAAPATAAAGWKLRIAASTGKSQDTWNFLGVSSTSKDGFDLSDYEKPPFINGAVRLEFTRDTWGTRAGVYAQDIQASAGGTKTWNVRVTTPAPNQDVTLSWPEITSLPRSYELFITDAATGQRQQMRQVPSIRVNTGDAATRSFVITAEPRTATSAFNLTVTMGASGSRAANVTTFAVASTQAATVTVRIKGSNGQTIRTLGGRAASVGTTASFVWDNRDAKGVSVASGSYIIEVTGTTADGKTRRAAQPLIIVR
jgi:hypothetical protein